MVIVYHHIFCVGLLSAKLWPQSAGLASVFHFKAIGWSSYSEWLGAKEKAEIWLYSCLLIWKFTGLIFFFRWISYKGFMNRVQALRVSPLKQSTGLSKKWRRILFSISLNMLLQFNLSAYDTYTRRALLTCSPFITCPNMHLESSSEQLF